MKWIISLILLCLIGLAIAVYIGMPVRRAWSGVSGTASLFDDNDSTVYGTYGFVGDKCGFVICFTEAATRERLKTKGGDAGGGNSPDGYYDWSTVYLENGQTIEWKWNCDYEGNGAVTLQGSKYDLTNGNLFVYQLTPDGRLKPRQLRQYIKRKPDKSTIARLRKSLLDDGDCSKPDPDDGR